MKGILKIVLVAFLFFPILLFGQEKKTKKLSSGSFSHSKLKKEDDDIFSLIETAESISLREPKKALDYLEQALSKSLEEGNKKGEAMSYATIGKINYQQGLYSQSADFYSKAIKTYQELNDQGAINETRRKLGNAYEASGSYDKALEQYNLVLKESEKTKNVNDIVEIKNQIGRTNEKLGKTEEALKNYNEVLTIEQKRNNQSGIINSNNNIGNIYLQQQESKKAREHYENAKEIAIESKDESKLAESYYNISKISKQESNIEEEISTREQSIKIKSSLKDKTSLHNEYIEIGKIYLQKKNYDEAQTSFKKGISLSKQNGDLKNEADGYLGLSEVYKKKGDHFNALENYQNYVKLKDSLYNTKEKNLASILSFNDEISLKQKKIDLLEKDMYLLKEEKKFSEWIILLLTGVLILVVGSSWLIYNSSRKRRIANQILALKSLRSQMNPHFIFNALNSVNNYISKNDERAANKYLSDFSKLMRTVMENSQHEFISLSTELEILKLYLLLEHSRFTEKFDYELTVSESLHTETIEIPPMLIQPYIENAVWHGLRYREDKGSLKVDISNEGAILKVVVQDNGIGRKRSQELKTLNQKDKVSTGLKNTESRLNIINELYRTELKVSMEDLDSSPNTGTKVTIFITPAKKVKLV